MRVCEDGRVGGRQHQARKGRDVQGGRLPEGHLSRVRQPGGDERDHRAKRGHLRHHHRIRKSRLKALSRNDGLSDHSRGQRAKRDEAAQHGPAVQAADERRGSVGDLQKIWDRGRRSKTGGG